MCVCVYFLKLKKKLGIEFIRKDLDTYVRYIIYTMRMIYLYVYANAQRGGVSPGMCWNPKAQIIPEHFIKKRKKFLDTFKNSRTLFKMA